MDFFNIDCILKTTDSASGALFFTGSSIRGPGVLKMTRKSDEGKTGNGTEVERYMYSHIVPQLQIYSPSLLSFHMKFENYPSQLIVDNIKGDDDKHRYKNWLKAEQYLNITVTERCAGMLITDFLQHCIVPGEYIAFRDDVLFQVAYLLCVFEDFGVMHHDLHTANVFVEKLSHPQVMNIRIKKNNGVFRKLIRYKIKVFDFDHAVKLKTDLAPDEMLNTSLNRKLLCHKYGECNEFTYNMDWFTFIHYLFQYGNNHDTTLFKIIKETLLKENMHPIGSLAWHGHPCSYPVFGGPCTKFQLDETFILQTPFQYLQNFEHGSIEGLAVFTLPRVVQDTVTPLSTASLMKQRWASSLKSMQDITAHMSEALLAKKGKNLIEVQEDIESLRVQLQLMTLE
jgi:hypothetical protein